MGGSDGGRGGGAGAGKRRSCSVDSRLMTTPPQMAAAANSARAMVASGAALAWRACEAVSLGTNVAMRRRRSSSLTHAAALITAEIATIKKRGKGEKA